MVDTVGTPAARAARRWPGLVVGLALAVGVTAVPRAAWGQGDAAHSLLPLAVGNRWEYVAARGTPFSPGDSIGMPMPDGWWGKSRTAMEVTTTARILPQAADRRYDPWDQSPFGDTSGQPYFVLHPVTHLLPQWNPTSLFVRSDSTGTVIIGGYTNSYMCMLAHEEQPWLPDELALAEVEVKVGGDETSYFVTPLAEDTNQLAWTRAFLQAMSPPFEPVDQGLGVKVIAARSMEVTTIVFVAGLGPIAMWPGPGNLPETTRIGYCLTRAEIGGKVYTVPPPTAVCPSGWATIKGGSRRR